MNKKLGSRCTLPPSVIRAACYGEPDAVTTVLRHYESYITKLSMRRLYDEYGNIYAYVDEDRRERLRIKLMSGILNYRG